MCHENSDLKLELSARAKKLSAAESKVSQLIESNRISLTKARECKKACTTAEEKVQALEQMLKAHDDDKDLEIQRCLDEAKIKGEVSTLFISLCIVINTFDSHYFCYVKYRIIITEAYCLRERRMTGQSMLLILSTQRN